MNPGSNIHAAGRGHPVAYMKRLAIKYIEILIDAGDNLFRQNTMESIPLALQHYVEASHIFGPVPIQMPQLQKRHALTYKQLSDKLDDLSNATVDLGLDFPFQSDPENRGISTSASPTTMAYIETGYFCIPSNPQIIAVKSLIDDRMYKIRNNIDIEGKIQDRPLFESSIDLGYKTIQKQEALKTIDLLEETRRAHEQRLAFFLALTGDQSQGIPGPETTWTDIPQLIDKPTTDDLRMASGEKLELDCTESAIETLPTASTLDNIAANLLIVPQGTVNIQPFGIGASAEIGTGLAARALQAAASVIRQSVQGLQDEAMIAGKKSSLIRQLQERRQQANQAGHDIKVVDQQVLLQKLQIERLDAELRAQVQNNENTAQQLEWYQSKYTNEQLYAWLENQYGSLYQDTYKLASQLAQKVQKAYYFENPLDETVYLSPIAGGCWDTSRDGLLSGARLSLDLKRIETAYLNSKPYDFEIEKTISLRQLHPLGLLSIRETGVAEFSLPETLFDIDFPGHYCRRIASVSLHIPCIMGAHVSLNCTLTLKSHSYRVKKDATSGTDYRQTDKDGVFRTDVIPITSIAVTSDDHGGGMFDFGPPSQKYLPFEGAGAISQWRIELPEKFRPFDYHTISDVVMHMKYTAVDGGQTLKNVASQATLLGLQEATTDSGSALASALVDIRCDYADEWNAFEEKMKAGEGDKAKLRMVTLSIMPALKPQDFNLQEALVLMGPSNSIAWASSSIVGDCTVLQSEDMSQDMKATGDWTLSFSAKPPNTFVVQDMVLVLEYTLHQLA
ncbi:hypothetical protein F5Y03DRAFT_403997 [Xylaria venustula]|nr:hypothetical protein F5Y03DRAFT_403997 [Xylaria venustula]